jgi:mannose-6-phosphate isomerase-like protein (cupin superfamily)
MARRSPLVLAALVTLAVVPAFVRADEPPAQPAAHAGTVERLGSSLQFDPLDLPGFVPGMKVAVLSGDPFKEGPYTLRLWFPAGYRFPAHHHPNVENLTVISGTFELGQGDKTDASKLKKYAPGDYMYIPPEHPHFGGAVGETVVQLHGPGPFGVTVLETMEGALPMAPAQ